MTAPDYQELVRITFPVFFCCLPGVVSGIDTANYSADSNRRFNDNPAFVGGTYDFSGVGRSNTGRWATLLGDNYFITANHFPAAAGQQVTFGAGNSLAEGLFSIGTGARGTVHMGVTWLE